MYFITLPCLVRWHSPGIHPVVDDWVHHRVGHGQPVEAQEQVLHVRFNYYVLVVVRVHKVRMVWQPTNEEYRHDHCEHPDYLSTQNVWVSNDSMVDITGRRVEVM